MGVAGCCVGCGWGAGGEVGGGVGGGVVMECRWGGGWGLAVVGCWCGAGAGGGGWRGLTECEFGFSVWERFRNFCSRNE